MPTEVPDFVYDIPDDASEIVKLHLRAQRVIQAAFYAFGDPDERPGSLSIGANDLLEVVTYAAGTLIAASGHYKTRRDIREATEHQAKLMRGVAEALQNDTSGPQLFAHLGIVTSKLN